MTPTTRLPLVAALLRIADEHECPSNWATSLKEAAALIEKQGALVASHRQLFSELELPLSMLITLGSKAGYDTEITFRLLQRVVAAAKSFGERE